MKESKAVGVSNSNEKVNKDLEEEIKIDYKYDDLSMVSSKKLRAALNTYKMNLGRLDYNIDYKRRGTTEPSYIDKIKDAIDRIEAELLSRGAHKAITDAGVIVSQE